MSEVYLETQDVEIINNIGNTSSDDGATGGYTPSMKVIFYASDIFAKTYVANIVPQSTVTFRLKTGITATFTLGYYDTDSDTRKYWDIVLTGGGFSSGLHGSPLSTREGGEDFFAKLGEDEFGYPVLTFKENAVIKDVQSNIAFDLVLDTDTLSFYAYNENEPEAVCDNHLYSQNDIDNWTPTLTTMQRIALKLLRINSCKANIKDSINDVIPSSLAITNDTSFELYSDALNNAKGLNCRIYEGLFSNIPLRPVSDIGAGWIFLDNPTNKFIYEPYKWSNKLAGFKIKSSDIQNVNWGENEKSVELNITIPSSNQKTTAQYFIDWEDTLKLYRGANSSIMYVWTPGVDGNGSTVSIGNHVAGYTYKFHLYADDNLILQIYSGSTLISSENVGIIPGNWDDLGEYIHFGSDASNSNEIQDNFIEMNSLSITTTKGSFEILPTLL